MKDAAQRSRSAAPPPAGTNTCLTILSSGRQYLRCDSGVGSNAGLGGALAVPYVKMAMAMGRAIAGFSQTEIWVKNPAVLASTAGFFTQISVWLKPAMARPIAIAIFT